jgi:hypothetical protein
LRDENNDAVKTITFSANDAIKAGGSFYIDATVSGGFLAQIAREATDPRLKVGLDGRDLSAERSRGGWGPPPISLELKQQLQKLGAEQDEETPEEKTIAYVLKHEEDEPEEKTITYVVKRESDE